MEVIGKHLLPAAQLLRTWWPQQSLWTLSDDQGPRTHQIGVGSLCKLKARCTAPPAAAHVDYSPVDTRRAAAPPAGELQHCTEDIQGEFTQINKCGLVISIAWNNHTQIRLIVMKSFAVKYFMYTS